MCHFFCMTLPMSYHFYFSYLCSFQIDTAWTTKVYLSAAAINKLHHNCRMCSAEMPAIGIARDHAGKKYRKFAQ